MGCGYQRKMVSGMRRIHEEPDLFREALELTREQTGFSLRLIEKDYFCSLLLGHLAGGDYGIVFKGGTCLAKVHADFYRLSEDMDYVVPMAPDASRSQRSRRAAPLKTAILDLSKGLPCFRVVEPLTGANSSLQYTAVVGYSSRIDGREETIKFEVGLREPLLQDACNRRAATVLVDPVSREPAVSPIPLRCMSLQESIAEKFRAALTRREVAARDFFDIDYAVRRLGIKPDDETLVDLIRRKLAVPGNAPADVSPERFAALRRQYRAQLEPVLRPDDFSAFDVERASGVVAGVAGKV